MAKLTTLSVKNARAGRHADGGGLYLLVKPTGGKSWLLRIQVGAGEDPLLFPGTKGGVLSDMTISKILRDMNLPYVPHGFRSSFRDWAAEKMPAIPDPVAEAALAHVVPDTSTA